MRIKKKNRFLTFCTSFVPGATELYIGFMKMGLSMLGLVAGFMAIAIFTQIGILVMPVVVLWIYGFFHANNLAALSQEELNQIEDNYLFGFDALTVGKTQVNKYRKWVATALIILGVILLWRTGMDFAYRFLPNNLGGMIYMIEDGVIKSALGVLVVAGGVRMIKGKKKELYIEEGSGEEHDEKTDN